MRILGQMRGFATRPYDDAYTMNPQGLVALGGHIIEGITCYRQADSGTNIQTRLVLRSFAPSLSTKELGRVTVYQQQMSTTDQPADESLPYPSGDFRLASLIKLDEQRLLVVFHHGTGTWSDTSTDSTVISTAFVVTCAPDGTLTRGPYAAMDEAVLGGVQYWCNLYSGPPILALTGPDTVSCFSRVEAPKDAVATNDAVIGAEFQVSGTAVTVGGWVKWVETARADGVGRPYPQGAFGLKGSPYVVVDDAPYQDGSYGPVLYGLAPGGPGWELGKDWSYYLRANHLQSVVYLLGSGLFTADGTSWKSGIVDRFDGSTLTRVRNAMATPPQVIDGVTLTYEGGGDWPPPEVDLVTPTGNMLIWTARRQVVPT